MVFPLSILTLIVLHLSTIAAQNGGRIAVGQSLSASKNGSSWLSASGDFAFGFHQYPNNTNLFLVAIWYAKIPDTIVWYANDGNPIPQGSSLKITSTDGLLLNDPQGTQLWSTADELNTNVDYGFMNDTGNFVLKSSSTDDLVWQTFNHPTDTLLPTQILVAGSEIDSRRSNSNFTSGRFQLRLQPDGNLVLSTKDLATGYAYDPYYASGTWNSSNSGNQGNKLIYDETGHLYLQLKNGSNVDVKPGDNLVSATENYLRVTLDIDGVLTWYYHPRNVGGADGWNIIQSIPDNICKAAARPDAGSGACGYNSICSIDVNQRPSCQCPPDYSQQDPDDAYSSCVPDFKQDVCEKQSQGTIKDQYNLVTLQNTDWPFADYAQLDPCSEEECKNSCLNDCFCAAAIFNAQTCWKKKLPLSNGQKDSSVDRIAWLKVGYGNVSNNPLNPIYDPSEKIKNKKNKLLTSLLSGSVSVNFLLLTAIILSLFFMYKRKISPSIEEQRIQMGKTLGQYNSVHCFSYKELEEATYGFEQKIGQGAFGTVYKGEITARGSPILVAVKKLHRISKDADKEFETEVNVIGQTHHKNLVRFIGFCTEGDQRLLIYEYMTNGTVADYLFSYSRPSWTARIQIALGIAKGLLYLHEECITQIIHCDIKPQNILLDDYYNARISDFGMAKLLVLNQTHTNTGIRGTKGYLAPEWFRNKPITVKVDVYSFGVLLLEIICCRRNVNIHATGEAAILTDWAFDCYQANTLESLVSDDEEALNDILTVERFAMIALWCIQEDPSARPTMKKVTQMLEGVAEVSSPPCPISFSITIQS